jgi:Ras-related protein Rab-8A
MRYTNGTFSEQFLMTLGVEYQKHHVNINGRLLTLQIWDTAGQEQFHAITKSYMRGADGIVVVYDVSMEESFERVDMWMESIRDTALTQVELILIGNKMDTENRIITTAQGEALGKKYGISHFETSAKTGQGVTEAFEELARLVAGHLEQREATRIPIPTSDKRCC